MLHVECDPGLHFNSIVLQGLSVVILGPTLLDLSNRVGVGISELAAILLVRSVGSVFGSVGSGFVCDHYQKASLWMLNANIFALALCTYIYIYIYYIRSYV